MLICFNCPILPLCCVVKLRSELSFHCKQPFQTQNQKKLTQIGVTVSLVKTVSHEKCLSFQACILSSERASLHCKLHNNVMFVTNRPRCSPINLKLSLETSGTLLAI